jgi:hypothetical protein
MKIAKRRAIFLNHGGTETQRKEWEGKKERMKVGDKHPVTKALRHEELKIEEGVSARTCLRTNEEGTLRGKSERIGVDRPSGTGAESFPCARLEEIFEAIHFEPTKSRE